MAVSKPTTEELLQQSIELQRETNELLSGLSTKAYNAEMRQCHTSGQSTDAIRMAEFFFRAESALLSSHTQRSLVEMMYCEGSLDGVEYQKVFGDKDTRRGELATVVFYLHVIEKRPPYNIFSTGSEHMHDMLKYMPSFRQMMLAEARRVDLELGPEKVQQLPFGSYEKRISEGLGELPFGLDMLLQLVHPLDKQYRPVPRVRDEDARDAEGALDPYESLPKKIKELIHWAETCGFVSSGDKKQSTTELVVKWCTHLGELCDMEWELEQDAFQAWKKSKKADEESWKRAELDKTMLNRHFELWFPEHDKIRQNYDLLQARKAAEKAAAEAAEKAKQASGEQAAEKSAAEKGKESAN